MGCGSMKMWKKIALTKRHVCFGERFARYGSKDKGNNRRRALGRYKYPAFVSDINKWLQENLEV